MSALTADRAAVTLSPKENRYIAMRSHRTAIALLVVCCLLACAGNPTPNTIAYRTVGSVDVAVQAGMNAWADYVVAGHATPAKEAEVRAAFVKYTSAAGVAASVLKVTNLSPAPADLAAAADKLLALLSSFGVGGKP